MKSLFRIVRRYTLNAVLITLAILSFNVGTLIFISYNVGKENENTGTLSEMLSAVSQGFEEQEGKYILSEAGYEALKEREYEWGMLLNPEGEIVWGVEPSGRVSKKVYPDRRGGFYPLVF